MNGDDATNKMMTEEAVSSNKMADISSTKSTKLVNEVE
jgi:hypothetical protein